MTTFFSVDVETTSTNVFVGQLLSIGIVAVATDGDIKDSLYCTLEYDDSQIDDIDTLNWWQEQNEEAFEEAWGKKEFRQNPVEVCTLIEQFVADYEKDWVERIFVANPVAFDKIYTEKLFHQCDRAFPFSYRALCLRSMQYGMIGGDYGKSRQGTNKPEIEHHALYDAYAQAEDLVDMLGELNATH